MIGGVRETEPSDGSSEADRVRVERDRLSLLLEVTNLLVTQRDVPSLFHALSNCISHVIPHDYASVIMYPDYARDPRHMRFELVMVDGTRRAELEGLEMRILEDAVPMFAAGKPLVFDINWIKGRNPPVAQIIGQFGISCFCVLPLTTARRHVGTLNVGSRLTDAFTP
jgi:hypothetical protein